MRVLLTNDDGIQASGLRAFYQALLEAGHDVQVVAPMSEQSAVGHSVTIHSPLRVKNIREHGFQGIGVHGTPTDCVKLGVAELVEQRPDIILSGINAGANVGPDILYSGTVAAATEGAHLGFPAMAVSYDSFKSKDILPQARYAVDVMEKLPWDKIPERRVLNLNLPDIPLDELKGLCFCPQTDAVWNDWYYRREDPRGVPYWWIDGKIPPENVRKGSDRDLLTEGWATVTPLKFEFTDQQTLAELLRHHTGAL